MRIVLFVQELGLDKKEYQDKIGWAIAEGLSPLEGSFKRAEQAYTIYVQKKATWDAVRDIIAGLVKVETDKISSVELEGRQMLKVRFRRVYKKSTHRFHSILNGFPHID